MENRPVPQPTDTDKIEMLERLVLALTGAEELSYANRGMGGKQIILTDIEVDDVRFANTCGTNEYAGLVLEFEPEHYIAEPPPELSDKLLPTPAARINAEIWFWEDLWKTIEELRKKVSDLQGNCGENHCLNKRPHGA